MAHIHVGQTATRLEFEIGLDITDAAEVTVQYKKPNTILGEFPGSILNASQGIVYYDIQSEGDLDDTGIWSFWVHVVFTDGTELDSNPISLKVYEAGKNYISHPYGRTSIDGGILMAIEAIRVIYNNNVSQLNGDDVQAALDEIKNLLDTLAAADISYSNITSSLAATDVQAAVDEIKNMVDALAVELGADLENIVYVAKNGSDTAPAPGVPLGTIDNPFLTVQAAIDSITDASSSKFYTVFVQPGTYAEDLTMKPWVNIIGRTKDGTVIENGGTHTCWFSDGGRVTIKSISLGSQELVVTHPFGAPGSSSISLRNVNVGDTEINFLGGGVDFVQIRNDVQILGDLTVHSGALTLYDSYVEGTLEIDDDNVQHVDGFGAASSNHLRASTLNTVLVEGNTFTELYGSYINDTLTIDGAQCTLRSDVSSMPTDPTNVTILNSGTLERISAAYALAYDNTTTGIAATNVQDALDEIHGLIP